MAVDAVGQPAGKRRRLVFRPGHGKDLMRVALRDVAQMGMVQVVVVLRNAVGNAGKQRQPGADPVVERPVREIAVVSAIVLDRIKPQDRNAEQGRPCQQRQPRPGPDRGQGKPKNGNGNAQRQRPPGLSIIGSGKRAALLNKVHSLHVNSDQWQEHTASPCRVKLRASGPRYALAAVSGQAGLQRSRRLSRA